MQLMPYIEKYLDKYKHTAIDSRGRQYYKNGKIESHSYAQNSILATVKGSSHAKYDVEIYFDKNNKCKLDCSCPYFEDNPICKHLVAVMYDYSNSSKGSESKNIATPVKQKPITDFINRSLLEDFDNNLLLNAIEYLKENLDYNLYPLCCILFR